jgi:hypothetical protein
VGLRDEITTPLPSSPSEGSLRAEPAARRRRTPTAAAHNGGGSQDQPKARRRAPLDPLPGNQERPRGSASGHRDRAAAAAVAQSSRPECRPWRHGRGSGSLVTEPAARRLPACPRPLDWRVPASFEGEPPVALSRCVRGAISAKVVMRQAGDDCVCDAGAVRPVANAPTPRRGKEVRNGATIPPGPQPWALSRTLCFCAHIIHSGH